MLVEKFREPNLSLDALRIEKTHKEKKIIAIKQKLAAVSHIRENLRANE